MGFFNEYPYTDFHELNLDWILEKVKFLLKSVEDIEGWIETHKTEYEELKSLYDDIIAGRFPDSIKEAFYTWCVNNITDLVGQLVHSVFFGLTDSGYFVAYIPESWDDIVFKTTGYDTIVQLMPEYGHLVLSY